LPEAQLDRFMFNIPVTYPSVSEEAQIVKSTTGNRAVEISPLVSGEDLQQLQRIVREVPVADSVVDYAVALSAASRPAASTDAAGVHRYIRYGASPRASQYLILGAKALAVLHGKFHVDFSDVQAVATPVLRHRIVLNFHARADQITAEQAIKRIVESVPCR
ncbi:MAG: MoxR family ATPase, partial [Planctomycetales bacterium]|nr:MoxR family ATPase [Planctomycetales bacterium]